MKSINFNATCGLLLAAVLPACSSNLQSSTLVPSAVVQPSSEQLRNRPRPTFHLHNDTARVGIWVAQSLYSYLLGLDKNAPKNLVAAIDVAANGCSAPATVKIDHAKNIWIGCQQGGNPSAAATGGAVQEYSSTGKLLNTYNWTYPCSTCSASEGVGLDGAEDAKGHVFAGIYSVRLVDGSFPGATGFAWWKASAPSKAPTIISLPFGKPVENVVYMDTDKSGNIWFDYGGISSGSPPVGGFGLAEIKNPTTKAKFVSVFPIGYLGGAGGVYVSHGGSVLNVTDTVARTTYQYHLPVTSKSRPFNTLGPTALDVYSLGKPLAGGFNQTDTAMVFGDIYGLDLGKVATNSWKMVGSVNLMQFLGGAAYTPSDK